MPKLLDISVEQKDLAGLALRFKELEGGKVLRASLIRNLRVAIAPAIAEAKAGATAISHGGSYHGAGSDTTPLGEAIARGITSQVRLTGPRVGVKVRAKKDGMPRGFKNAPNRMNRPSFEHPVFGHRGTWVVQIGNPDFFDGPLKRDKEKYRIACIEAMTEIAALMAVK